MKKAFLKSPSQIRFVEITKGERIETKVERITRNNEPIKDAAESIFDTEQFGINPDTNIRSDRFVIAVETMDKVNRSRVAKRLNDKKDGRTVEDNATESIVTD